MVMACANQFKSPTARGSVGVFPGEVRVRTPGRGARPLATCCRVTAVAALYLHIGQPGAVDVHRAVADAQVLPICLDVRPCIRWRRPRSRSRAGPVQPYRARELKSSKPQDTRLAGRWG